ncbi:hypothetical protein R50073_02660 [Maricurvus nonylphenolicus]|uniref:hypothetical protein n=1 Tax=Maricurvus nonylphenolicus TaxID=1008307 RepID=UPI0036F23100
MFFSPRAQSLWRRYLLSLVAVLLLAQTAEIGHIHADLEAANECTICCLHHGSGEGASSGLDAPAVTFSQSSTHQEASTQAISLGFGIYSIRAPPSFTV